MFYPNKLLILLTVWRFTTASPLLQVSCHNIFKNVLNFVNLQQRLSVITTLVGGVEVTPHSLPYQVAILINNAYFCGGVLISPKYVLTAAHCVYK